MLQAANPGTDATVLTNKTIDHRDMLVNTRAAMSYQPPDLDRVGRW